MSAAIAFQSILDALVDNDRPFPSAYLPRFSDIGVVDLKAALDTWPKVAVKRRRELLNDLRPLAENDTLLSFDDFARSVLDDPDGQVRAAAIRLLWECEDAKLAPLFMQLLSTDLEPAVRAAAASALGLFVQSGELEEIPASLHHQVEDALLVAATGGDEAHVRRQALESLGYSSRSEVPALIEAAYNRSQPDWVASALLAMGRSSDDRWQDQVLFSLLNDNTQVCASAAQAAGELSLRLARPILFKMLEEEDDLEVIKAAIWSLSQIGGEDVRIFLQDLLDEAVDADDDSAAFIEEALDNLDFTEEMGRFDILAIDPDDELEDKD